jgi:hypothetical protein
MSSATLKDKHDSNMEMLNPEQVNQLFENLVNSYLGISSEEFLKRYRQGEYKDACNDPRLLKILIMVPKGR